MHALSQEGDQPSRANLQPVLREIGLVTHDEVNALIAIIRTPAVSQALKSEADRIHPHITGHLSADEVSAITANAIAVVAGLPDWQIIPTSGAYRQPRIS